MEYRIRAYVDELFESAPRTQRAYELKIELTQAKANRTLII